MASSTDAAIQKTTELVDSVMVQSQKVISKYGPEVVDATLTLIRIEQWYNFIILAICIAVGMWGVKFSSDLYKHYESPEIRASEDLKGFLAFIAIVSYVIPIGFFIGLAANAFTIFLGIYDPRLYLLHRAIDKIL